MSSLFGLGILGVAVATLGVSVSGQSRAPRAPSQQGDAPFYAAKLGRPILTPGTYVRLLLIGYFEDIDSERGIAWRTADSLVLCDHAFGSSHPRSRSPSPHRPAVGRAPLSWSRCLRPVGQHAPLDPRMPCPRPHGSHRGSN